MVRAHACYSTSLAALCPSVILTYCEHYYTVPAIRVRVPTGRIKFKPTNTQRGCRADPPAVIEKHNAVNFGQRPRGDFMLRSRGGLIPMASLRPMRKKFDVLILRRWPLRHKGSSRRQISVSDAAVMFTSQVLVFMPASPTQRLLVYVQPAPQSGTGASAAALWAWHVEIIDQLGVSADVPVDGLPAHGQGQCCWSELGMELSTSSADRKRFA
nr:hypothetical protein CFP56_24582 [Quercus suber]